MNEILQLLDNLIVCGESMAKIGRVLKEFLPEFTEALPQKAGNAEISNTAVPEEQPAKEEPAKTYTFSDVRKAFSAKSHAGYTVQVKELISKYGADRLSDVKEEDYPALMADLEVIG
jgi:hypothetical protein